MISKFLLFPYYLGLKLRHLMYDTGIRKRYKFDVPTICVGNIAAGGTGKTPHTEMIIRTLLNHPEWKSKNIAVLSRGHKRKSSGFQQVVTTGTSEFFGDEPLQIKKRFPNITVAVDRSRIEGCHFLLNPQELKTDRRGENCLYKNIKKPDLIILDDAFQYRDLITDYNIILVDYNRPVSKDNLLPIGRLRDLPSRLCQADILIVTKCPHYLDEWERQKWMQHLSIKDFDAQTCTGINKKGKTVKVLFTSIDYCAPEPVYPEGDLRYIYSKNLILFSGIAKDTPLRRYLGDSYKIIKHFKFADHHKYRKMDINRILKATKQHPTAMVATTEKDSQRLRDYTNMPLELRERIFQIPIKVNFLTDQEQEVFDSSLMNILNKE